MDCIPRQRKRRYSERSVSLKRTIVSFAFFILASIAGSSYLPAQQAKTPAEILASPAVQSVMQAIKTNEPHFIEEQIRLCEISSPPFHEDKRAAELAPLFPEAGLANV